MKRFVLVLLTAVVLATLYFLPDAKAAISLGNGLLAKQMCSCVYVAERSFESCRDDVFPMVDRLSAERLVDDTGIRAYVPLFGQRVATFEPNFGCTLGP